MVAQGDAAKCPQCGSAAGLCLAYQLRGKGTFTLDWTGRRIKRMLGPTEIRSSAHANCMECGFAVEVEPLADDLIVWNVRRGRAES